MRAIVIGAGIGGLTLANAARKLGIDVVICERASALTEVGAGISLWGNAMCALDALGVGNRVRARAMRGTYSQFRNSRGRALMTVNLAEVEKRRNLPPTVWMIHRAELIEALGETIPPESLRLGKTCVGIETRGEKVVATFSDGHTEEGDLVIGADGLRSAVRAKLFGQEPPRYSGYTCWRGITAGPFDGWPAGHVAEIWGRGARFGVVSLTRGRVYWFAAVNAPEGMSEADSRGMLERVFGTWADPVPAILAATPEPKRLRNDIYDRPPLPCWSKGRATLLGDAAHPTTPNLGQGGCMAIEDGVILADWLARGVTLENALAGYQRDRFDRTTAITRQSRQLGIIGHWENPLACALRDWGTRLTPSSVAFKSLLKWTQFDPPASYAKSSR